MIPFGELNSQFRALKAELRQAIDSVLESGWFVLGRQVQGFEEAFSEYVGVRHAVGVGSGTEALHLALRALGVRPGDEVITAANTCVPTVSAISFSGATPVLADCSPATLTMAPDSLARAITPRTKAIIPVHLYGHPCDMTSIMQIADARGIPVIEDCAQAHGAEWKGVKCGAFGRAAAFSFYPSKNLGAYGDAGAVVTQDEALAATLRRLRNYGEERRNYHSIEGFNSRLDEMQAAILAVKLKHLDKWNVARRERARLYSRLLAQVPVLLPHEATGATPVYHLYVTRSEQRDALQAHLEARGIKTLIHYPIPIHLQQAYAHLNQGVGALPEAERACRTVLSLPLYPELSETAIECVCAAIREFLA